MPGMRQGARHWQIRTCYCWWPWMTQTLRGAGCWAWQDSALLPNSSAYHYRLLSIVVSTGQQFSLCTLIVLPPFLASSYLSLPQPTPCTGTLCTSIPPVRLAPNLAAVFLQHLPSILTVCLNGADSPLKIWSVLFFHTATVTGIYPLTILYPAYFNAHYFDLYKNKYIDKLSYPKRGRSVPENLDDAAFVR